MAWLEYARKKPSLRRLVFERTPGKDLNTNGWVSEPLYASPPPPAEVPLPPKRSGVFGYLDGEVAKEMAGLYDAFGMQQPTPPAEVAAEKARRDAEGGAQ